MRMAMESRKRRRENKRRRRERNILLPLWFCSLLIFVLATSIIHSAQEAKEEQKEKES